MRIATRYSGIVLVFALTCSSLFVRAEEPPVPVNPAELKQVVEEAIAREAELQNAIKSNETQVQTLSEQLKAIQESLNGLQQQVSEAEANLKMQEENLASVKAKKEEALTKIAAEAETRKQAAEADLKAKQESVNGLNTQLRKVQTDLLEAKKNLEAAQAELKKEQDAVAAQNAEKEKLAQMAAAADKVFQEADAAAKAAAETARLAAEAARTAQVKVEEAQKNLTIAEQAVATREATIVETQKAIDAAPQMQEQIEAQLTEMKGKVDAVETQLAVVTEEFVARRKELESVLIDSGKFVSFSESIAPIFAKRCLSCHDTRTAKGRYNMETFAAILKGGESGAAIEHGDADASNLYILVESGSMPEDDEPLSADELATIKKWINLGAPLDAGVDDRAQLITIMPKQPHPAPPESYRAPLPVTALTFNPDGSQLASSGYHEILLWNAADGKLVQRITNVAERINDIEYSPDGMTLAVAAGTPGQMGEVKLFDVATGELKMDLVTSIDSVFTVKFSPTGDRVACGGADRAIRVFNVAGGALLTIIEDHADWVMDVAWSPEGTKIASASRDKTSKVFDVASSNSLVTFNGHGQPVFAVGFNAEGTQLITGGGDKHVRVWQLADGKEVRAIGGFGNDIFQLEIHPDGQFYSASADKVARLHNYQDGKELKKFTGHSDWVYCVTSHAGTSRIATGSYDGEIRIWNRDDAALVSQFLAAPGLSAEAITSAAP